MDKKEANKEDKVEQKPCMVRHTRFEAGFRAETAKYFISGTVYTFMTPVVC
jgi:hypothetical protein